MSEQSDFIKRINELNELAADQENVIFEDQLYDIFPEVKDNEASRQVILDEDDYTLVIPDIVVLCDQSKLGQKGIIGAPDWVIEVISPSTRSYDYNRKMHKYMATGVREYWIIDPLKEKVITYVEGETLMAHVYDFTESVPVYIYGGKLQICISEL